MVTASAAQLIEAFAERLAAAGNLAFGHGAADAKAEAALLVLGYLDAHPTAAEAPDALESLLRRRIEARIPAAYLTGRAWFGGRWFEVVPGVMIPRSPLQEMIGDGLSPWLKRPPTSILDLCCGSGALGIAAALRFPGAHVALTDIDPTAVACARRNIDRFGLAGRVEAHAGSLFDALPRHRYDLILANPPYVGTAELEGLPLEHRHEPRLGLAAGADGLDCWRSVLAGVGNWLADDGLLAGEIGNAASALRDAYPCLAFIWPELENAERLADGTFGVFVLDAESMRSCRTA